MDGLNADFGASIRPVTGRDVPSLKHVIASTTLFPAEMLDDMIAPFLAGKSMDDNWLTYDAGELGAVAYFTPEKMTQGTWNLLLIAVRADLQRQGIGKAVVRHIENVLAARGGRILLVETSGLPEFAAVRSFYSRLGYHEEARIREFYQAGEDKIIFRKAIKDSSTRAGG